MKKGAIFRGIDESVNLIFPLIFVFFVGLYLSMGWSPNKDGLPLFSFLVGTILMGLFHVPLGMAGFFVIPEMKAWAKERLSQSEGRRWLFRSLAASGALFFLFWAAESGEWFANPVAHKVIFYIGMTFFFAMRVQHSVAQSMGLSLLYNRNEEDLSEERRARLRRAEAWERRFATFLIVAVSLQGLVVGLTAVGIWTDPVPFLRTALRVVCFIAAMSMVLPALAVGSLNKTIFSLRYLLWPWALEYNWVGLGMLGMHGLEYLFFIRKISAESDGAPTRFWMWTPALIGFLACLPLVMANRGGFYSVFYGYTSAVFVGDPLPGFLKAMIAARLAFTIFHYSVDRELFRMRHPVSRKAFGKFMGFPEVHPVKNSPKVMAG